MHDEVSLWAGKLGPACPAKGRRDDNIGMRRSMRRRFGCSSGGHDALAMPPVDGPPGAMHVSKLDAAAAVSGRPYRTCSSSASKWRYGSPIIGAGAFVCWQLLVATAGIKSCFAWPPPTDPTKPKLSATTAASRGQVPSEALSNSILQPFS